VIAREKRDYVWVMARKPVVSPEEYSKLIDFVESLGYEKSLIRKVPQETN
jgi:apolipoprotein D and lipocalin family protein